VTERLLRLGIQCPWASRVDAHECDKQPRESVRQHPYPPEFEGETETRPLFGVELDCSARSYGFECRDDGAGSRRLAEFLEQCVPIAPGDFDDFACEVDLDFVESAGHSARTTLEGLLR
jgi:hypothetical protein